jgi:phospholipid/cholesterol/gamma-HCH transport system permease protein
MVAGRSGSAFAAEIGAMKVHQEIDAMRTLALDPMEMLVLPRMLALVVAVPLLAFIADIAGLAGGATVSWLTLDITPPMFIERVAEVTSVKNFWVGVFKAPFFGFLIALIGCYEGFRVEGSAESVGQHTTKSVVESIFVVIVADALFSIFFVQIGW